MLWPIGNRMTDITWFPLRIQIFNLKFTAKQLARASIKCEKEQATEKLKVCSTLGVQCALSGLVEASEQLDSETSLKHQPHHPVPTHAHTWHHNASVTLRHWSLPLRHSDTDACLLVTRTALYLIVVAH